MNIILCLTSIFQYMEDYILSIVNIIKGVVILIDNNSVIHFTHDNNYIFIKEIDDKLFNYIENNNVYLINTEQLSSIINQQSINKYPKQLNIIDYMSSNLKYYDNKYTKYLLPYQINLNEIYNFDKQKDVGIIGVSCNIPFSRQNVINLLKEQNINVDIITGWNNTRDIELFKYKIILNIGFHDSYKIMESFRCDRCVYNKIIVISDTKEDIHDYYLKDYIIYTNYQNIHDTTIEVLNNYDYYYNKLFLNFTLENINTNLFNLSKDIVDKLNCNNI